MLKKYFKKKSKIEQKYPSEMLYWEGLGYSGSLTYIVNPFLVVVIVISSGNRSSNKNLPHLILTNLIKNIFTKNKPFFVRMV